MISAVLDDGFARCWHVVAALGFLPPVFLMLTSVDVMIVATASRQVAPEVFAGIAVLVVLVVVGHRLFATWAELTVAILGRTPRPLRGIGAAAAVGGPVGLLLAASLDLAAVLTILGAALPELIAMAAAAAIVSVLTRFVYRSTTRLLRAHRERRRPR